MVNRSQLKISPIHAQVISQTPGRIRMRVAHSHRQKHKMEPIAKALQEQTEIHQVKTNLHSGSITIFHWPETSTFEDMRRILLDLGFIFFDVAEESLLVSGGHSSASAGITRVATDLNQRVKRLTQETVDLRFMIPFSFGILALRQLVIKGWQFNLIPWYVLAWYAFDSFLKLNQTDDE